MLQMILLETINFSHPPILIDILESPMRFWNETGISRMEVPSI
jgi:hypothetical protein